MTAHATDPMAFDVLQARVAALVALVPGRATRADTELARQMSTAARMVRTEVIYWRQCSSLDRPIVAGPARLTAARMLADVVVQLVDLAARLGADLQAEAGSASAGPTDLRGLQEIVTAVNGLTHRPDAIAAARVAHGLAYQASGLVDSLVFLAEGITLADMDSRARAHARMGMILTMACHLATCLGVDLAEEVDLAIRVLESLSRTGLAVL